MNAEPDYVNEPLEAEWYDGDIPDDCRCQYQFQHSHEYDGRDVQGRPCGLLVIGDLEHQRANRCYFHYRLQREHDHHLKPVLERAVQSRPYLGEALLWKAHLEGANLPSARLDGAGLNWAHLEGADLPEAHLEGARLVGAHLEAARLFGAHLESARLFGAHLEGAHLRGCSLRNADLRLTTIGSLQEFNPDTNTTSTRITDLRDAHLSGALLAWARIEPQADLSGARIDSSLFDEYCARSEREWDTARDSRGLSDWQRPTFPDCEAVYRQLKLNFQESGDYPEAGKFFFREMECKRARMLRDPETQPAFWGRAGALLLFIPVLAALLFRALTGEWPDRPVWQPWALCALLCFALWAWPARRRAGALWLTLLHWLCGYGEQVWRIALWIAVVIAGSAALYAHFGIADPNQPGAYKVNPGAAWPWGPDPGVWATCLYFSVITFTSLGYADLAPSSGWGRFLAGAEAGIGFLLMSLLLVCVVRKFTR